MKTLTLFNAYVAARDEMGTAASARVAHFRGIATGKDRPAKLWQRKFRLASKLEGALTKRLSD